MNRLLPRLRALAAGLSWWWGGRGRIDSGQRLLAAAMAGMALTFFVCLARRVALPWQRQGHGLRSSSSRNRTSVTCSRISYSRLRSSIAAIFSSKPAGSEP